MLFRRIAVIGVMLAAISAGVIQIRLMNAAAAREIHLLEAQQRDVQRQLWQQEMELARLRTPQRIIQRLASTGTDFLPPGANRPSDVPPRQPTEPSAAPTPDTASADAASATATPSIPTNPAVLNRHSGGSTHTWPSHSTRNSPRRPAR